MGSIAMVLGAQYKETLARCPVEAGTDRAEWR
jgi:hypothetical protein